MIKNNKNLGNHWFVRPFFISSRRDSNPRPTDYESVALPTELRKHHIFAKAAIKRNATYQF